MNRIYVALALLFFTAIAQERICQASEAAKTIQGLLNRPLHRALASGKVEEALELFKDPKTNIWELDAEKKNPLEILLKAKWLAGRHSDLRTLLDQFIKRGLDIHKPEGKDEIRAAKDLVYLLYREFTLKTIDNRSNKPVCFHYLGQRQGNGEAAVIIEPSQAISYDKPITAMYNNSIIALLDHNHKYDVNHGICGINTLDNKVKVFKLSPNAFRLPTPVGHIPRSQILEPYIWRKEEIEECIQTADFNETFDLVIKEDGKPELIAVRDLHNSFMLGSIQNNYNRPVRFTYPGLVANKDRSIGRGIQEYINPGNTFVYNDIVNVRYNQMIIAVLDENPAKFDISVWNDKVKISKESPSVEHGKTLEQIQVTDYRPNFNIVITKDGKPELQAAQ